MIQTYDGWHGMAPGIDFQEHHGNGATKRSTIQVSSIGRTLSASDSNSSPWLKHQWRLMVGVFSGESPSRF